MDQYLGCTIFLNPTWKIKHFLLNIFLTRKTLKSKQDFVCWRSKYIKWHRFDWLVAVTGLGAIQIIRDTFFEFLRFVCFEVWNELERSVIKTSASNISTFVATEASLSPFIKNYNAKIFLLFCFQLETKINQKEK
jgi:hypothetical protein